MTLADLTLVTRRARCDLHRLRWFRQGPGRGRGKILSSDHVPGNEGGMTSYGLKGTQPAPSELRSGVPPRPSPARCGQRHQGGREQAHFTGRTARRNSDLTCRPTENEARALSTCFAAHSSSALISSHHGRDHVRASPARGGVDPFAPSQGPRSPFAAARRR